MSRLNSVSQLNPTFGDRLYALMAELQKRDGAFRIFETVRAPERQNELRAQGRSRAAAYQSAHQYGLAADIVFSDGGVWTWPPADDPRWEPLRLLAPSFGLETLSFERPHVEIEGFHWGGKLTPGPADTAGWLSWLEARNKGGSK